MNPVHPFAPLVRFAVVIAALGINVHAATVVMISDNTAGESWVTAADWSDGVTASSGNDYVVGANFLLRSPTSGSSMFPGDSLELSGQFNLASGNGATTTVNNLRLLNGVIVNANVNSTQSLEGTLDFGSSTSFIKSTGTTAATVNDVRNIIVNSAISGTTQARAHFLRNGTFTLTNPLNSFSGTWLAGGTGVVISGGNPSPGYTVSNNSSSISTLTAMIPGSLGINASVVLDVWSRFDVDYDWTTTGSLTLMTNGGINDAVLMTLDQNITVGGLTIAGTSLNAATYSYSALSTVGFGDYFVDFGGSITVIPEPNAALIAAGGFGVALSFSRRRRLSV